MTSSPAVTCRSSLRSLNSRRWCLVAAAAAAGGLAGRSSAAPARALLAWGSGARPGRRPRGSLAGCRAEKKPRDCKRVGNQAWFDVVLSLPLGLALEDRGDFVVVTGVGEQGSAAKHNQEHLFPDEERFTRQLWIQEGDKLLMVNGKQCGSTEAAVSMIQAAEDPESVRFKFARTLGGNVKVVFPEDDTEIVAPAGMQVAEAAEQAGHEVTYKCTDGTCGSCWRQDENGEVFFLCVDDFTVEKIPSKNTFKDLDLFWSEKEYRDRKNNNPYFDNTEPLVLRSCPEVYAEWRKENPLQAFASDATVSRFGGVMDGMAPGQSEDKGRARSSKWGLRKSWTGGEAKW